MGVTGPGQLRPGVRLQPNGLKQLLRRRGRAAHVPRCHSHRFRHTFATWAIQQDARELDVQHLLGHAGPEMVRRYTASYRAEDAARRHARFSPADQMLGGHPRSANPRPASPPTQPVLALKLHCSFLFWEPAQFRRSAVCEPTADASQAEGRGFESLLPLQGNAPYIWTRRGAGSLLVRIVDHLLTEQGVSTEIGPL